MSNFTLPARFDDPKYDIAFWNIMRNRITDETRQNAAVITSDGGYSLPSGSYVKMAEALTKASLFRQIATFMKAYGNPYRIMAKDQHDMAEFIPDGGEFAIYDGVDDFSIKAIDSYKLGVFLKLDEGFVRDASFNIENYLIKRLAKNFGEAETAAFINGTGVKMPTGILADKNGAEVGVTAEALTYDDIIHLYFSVKPEYRENGIWLMNDETAYTLRTLKDADGNYLWNHSDGTILGKKVVLTRHMPGVAAGAKPVAFGDFSYYWVIGRKAVSIQTLTEKFALNEQIGYLAYEFLDGKLIRPEAIKVIRIAA